MNYQPEKVVIQLFVEAITQFMNCLDSNQYAGFKEKFNSEYGYRLRAKTVDDFCGKDLAEKITVLIHVISN